MKKILLLFLSLFLCLNLSSCNNKENNGIKIRDILNRKITLPLDINRVVCVGTGTLRLYSYIGDMNLICGVEDCEKEDNHMFKKMAVRPYSLVYSSLFKNLPSCGLGGGKNQFPEPEKILICRPDIVLTTYTDIKSLEQLNVPIIVLSYGTKDVFDNCLYQSLNILGKIFSKQERSKQIIDYIKEQENFLFNKTKDITFEDKPSLYLGCLSKAGLHGIESSHADYPLFEVSNIRNILKENGFKGYQKEVDIEKLLSMNPDKIIIDVGGINILKQQYAKDNYKQVFNNLDAFKNKEVYVQLPYNSYYTNLEIALCNAYYEASIAYRDLYKDFNLTNKYEEIFSIFYTKDVYYKTIEKVGYSYGKLDLESTFPNYKK